MALAADHARDGYAVLPAVFDAGEVEALNAEAQAVAGRDGGLASRRIEDVLAIHFPHKLSPLMRGLDAVPEAIRAQVRDQGGGHANHPMFWKMMAPPGQGGGGEPAGDLAAQVSRDFGSLDGMRQAISDAAAKRFGSGWVFLLFDPKAGKLEIETTANQDSALLLGKPALLGNDLWGHACYLKHRITSSTGTGSPTT